MMRPCLFCSIATHKVPATIIWEDGKLLAFLDINPIRPGHTQIIPKEHFPYFEDLPADLLGNIASLAQRIAQTQKAIYGVERVGFAFTGSDIPHVHAHVVPLVRSDDLTSRRYIAEEVVTYRNPPRPTEAEMIDTAEKLRQHLR
jgi:histidine triad (HIT) family protein